MTKTDDHGSPIASIEMIGQIMNLQLNKVLCVYPLLTITNYSE